MAPVEVIEYTGATERIALEPMRDLVYGRPLRREAAMAGAVDVAAKTDGVTTGAVR